MNRWIGLGVLIWLGQTATVLVARAQSAPALATADHESGSARAEVIEQKRIAGGMLMLRVAITNNGRETLNMSREYVDPRTGDVYSVSGLTLIDPTNKKKYFVVRDAANNCVCSEGLKDLKPGGRIIVWARFPSPPEGVQKISVMIPHFTPMDDVAIGK
jgi:hypothetical protein